MPQLLLNPAILFRDFHIALKRLRQRANFMSHSSQRNLCNKIDCNAFPLTLHSKSKLLLWKIAFLEKIYFGKEFFWSAFLYRQTHLMRLLPYSNTLVLMGSNFLAADQAMLCKKKTLCIYLYMADDVEGEPL